MTNSATTALMPIPSPTAMPSDYCAIRGERERADSGSVVVEVSRTPLISTPEPLGARVTPWTARIP